MNKKPIIALLVSSLLLFTLAQFPMAQAASNNRCLQFTGNNYAEIGSRIIPVDKDFTVEMWVYSSVYADLASFSRLTALVGT